MIYHCIILTAAALVSFSLHGQPSWRIDKLGVDDGLSEGNVYVIHQDRKGFIWIGTHGGLNRYDGYGFRVFQYDPFESSTLGDNAVFFLKEDTVSGKFWIGGSSFLNEFDPERFTNTRYRYEKKQLEFADGVFVSPHEILLACEHEVLLFDKIKKQFFEIPVYDENNKLITITRVENTAADRSGNFMVMSRTGVFFFDPQTKTCRRRTSGSPDFSLFNKHEVFNVIQDASGSYWIATNKKGLIRFNSQTKQATTVTLPSTFRNDLLRFDVVAEDSRRNIWAGASDGMFTIDPATLKAEFFSITTDRDPHADRAAVNVISEDRNGFMWIGTVGAGIYKMIPVTSGFHNIVLTDNKEAHTGSYVMAVQQMGNDIWFTNIWDQVGRVNLKTGKTSLLEKPTLPENYGWYSEGTLISNDENGLIMLNAESRYDIRQSSSGSIAVNVQPSPGLSYIYKANNKKIWYMVKAPVEKTFHRHDTIYGNQFFYDAKEDKNGTLWIGSSRGLIRFDPSSDAINHYQHDYNNRNSVSSDFIYKLAIDNNSENIWMAAYHGGLCSYNISTATFRRYSKEDGISDNTVYSIEKDHHGNLWFSSNAGISSYHHETKTFRNYGPMDGLLNHEFNRRSSFQNKAGWIFFGGIYGIDYFHPDSIAKNQTSPILAFTNFRVFNRDRIPARSDVPTIELSPSERQVTVEFTSLDYNDQQKIQYAYRVNDSEWIRIGDQHILSFTDLAIGDHRLYIRSTNNEGVWLDNEISCLIVAHPFWWQTWWFQTIIVFLAAGAMILIIRVYYQRKLEKQKVLLERQQAVEKERTRIATDMHDDLGANLSRIKFLSETIAMKSQKEERIDSEVSSIRNYSFDMINKMGEIVWALNERNDSLNDLLAYTRSYAVEYLTDNGIKAEVQIPEHLPDMFVTGDFRRNVYLTVKEALHNIVKHAAADRVKISIEVARHLLISIQDNGKGFDEMDVRPFSNGISNMKKRISSLGGNVEIQKTGGSTVTLVVPIP